MEFDVDPNGRMFLQRDARFKDRTDDDRFTWELRLVVSGMAGAVSAGFVARNHRTSDRLVGLPGAVTADWEPVGTFAHAYRPWPTGTDGQVREDCDLLALGSCFSQRLDDKDYRETSRLLTRLANPGGLTAVFERLEQLYVQEFCPPNEQRHYEAELERLAATVEAYERAARPAVEVE
jgi:hypothetical protein